MPESNAQPPFKDLWQRIAERASRGKNIVLSPMTALRVAQEMMLVAKNASQDRFNFAVEQWTDDGLHVEEVLAQCRHPLNSRKPIQVWPLIARER